ncbi:hypothetical protein AB0B25_01835 [Nocardia sp. NPDC049190]
MPVAGHAEIRTDLPRTTLNESAGALPSPRAVVLRNSGQIPEQVATGS